MLVIEFRYRVSLRIVSSPQITHPATGNSCLQWLDPYTRAGQSAFVITEKQPANDNLANLRQSLMPTDQNPWERLSFMGRKFTRVDFKGA